jgi:hypothetical protein
LAQKSAELYFGLGDALKIDGIEIRYSSGFRQAVTAGIELNREIEIRESYE